MHPSSDCLNSYLRSLSDSAIGDDLACTIGALSRAAVELHHVIRRGGVRDTAPAGENASGETQKPLDILADELFLAAARSAPLHCYASEEQEQAIALRRGNLALALDPLDGSSNIETNIAVGTIFSILPAPPRLGSDPGQLFAQPGQRQLAAGFFIYGAQLLLVLTCGNGTDCFAYDDDTGRFAERRRCVIPEEAGEYSVNAANRRHWTPDLRGYLDGLEQGREGPRGRDFGMRYAGSLVADAYRILQRGGIFLYPADRRPGYGTGRLRQLYEANPIALCIEQAGGAATDGEGRILNRPVKSMHGKVPLIFGSSGEVAIATRHLTGAA